MSETKKKGLYKNILSGGISASISRTIICPIERIEILRQISNKEHIKLSFFNSMKHLYSTQGFFGLFKGNSASLMRIFPFSNLRANLSNYFSIFLKIGSDPLIIDFLGEDC